MANQRGNIANLKPIHFPKGVSGNPNGRPKKLFSKFGEYGYKPSQINTCLEILIGLTESQLKEIKNDAEATALEKMMANAILEDIKNKTFHTFQPIVNRIAGMPKQSVEVDTNDKTEIIRIALELYRAKINEGLAQDVVLQAVLALVADKTTVRLTAQELLTANDADEHIIEGEIVE